MLINQLIDFCLVLPFLAFGQEAPSSCVFECWGSAGDLGLYISSNTMYIFQWVYKMKTFEYKKKEHIR